MNDPGKSGNNVYIRMKKIPIEDGLALIRAGQPTVFMEGYIVSTNSLRLQTFLHHGIKCVHPGCNRTGKFWGIERDSKGSKIIRFHMNLWAYDDHGNEALMTCDHIIARSLGGQDIITNTQTMCARHNSQKSKEEQKIIQEKREFEKTARALLKAQVEVGGLSLKDPHSRERLFGCSVSVVGLPCPPEETH